MTQSPVADSKSPLHIGIIGAGISGLSAAWFLAGRGHRVEILERAPAVGGLISTFDFEGLRVDRFYHFLCLQDTGYFQLCKELGLADQIRFVKARTGFYHAGQEHPFTSPLDLLRFSAIPFSQRLRFGLFALEARFRSEWKQLDELTGRPWLIDRIGQQAYDTLHIGDMTYRFSLKQWLIYGWKPPFHFHVCNHIWKFKKAIFTFFRLI